MNKLIILLMALLIFALGSGIGTAKEITVQPGGPIQSIQAAVNSASSGDTIIVKPGTYSENITISKPNLIIKSESGNPEDTVITAKNVNASVFYTTANYTTISGFKVNSGGYSGVTGIRLSKCSNCAITNNNLSGNSLGIYLSDSKYNTISGNSVNSNSRYGIHLVRSEVNTLSNNNANSNGHGFVLENNSNGNTLTSNIASSSAGLTRSSGFYSTYSSNNTLNKNIAINNPWGIYFINSNISTISGNDVSNNNEYGMWISLSNYNTISGNIANETRRGIFLDSSSHNTLSENVVAFNDIAGLYECPGCHYNTIFNNYLNNVRNADIRNRDTTWYKSKAAGINIVGGPYIGGNFWGKPDGKGFSQNATDANGDGLADTEYNEFNITDKLPLVAGISYLPVANFNANPVSGYAPLSVQFTDLSQNATGRNWDFENDGIVDSTDKNPVHNYTVPKNYTVKLTAINANGTTSTYATITVLKPAGILPVANFSANVTSGPAPLAVQFIDLSQNASLWAWDFNNDGVSESTDQNPINLYTNPGNYTVNLTAGNGNGTNSTSQQIIVQKFVVLPVADPGANVTSGYIPLTVLFTDLSQNISSRSWDIGNDGTIESTDASFVYEFGSRGDYPVNLTVSNENGTASKLITISAQRKSSSGGSSGGSGGGGGAGGSPEPAKNVKVKELSQVFITSGKSVKFDFPKNATSIAYLAFDSKKTVGKTTTIVEMLKNKSTLTSDAPTGEVCNYLNIWVGNGGYGSDEDNLENAVVCFKVEKSWIQDKGIDQSSIILNRYSDKKWNGLPTTLSGEDDTYLYFTAQTPGFSPFAITGKTTAKETDTEIQPNTEDSKENTGNTAAEVEQQPTNEENATTPEKESNSIPGFEMIYGVAGLLAVFLHKRK